MQGFQGLGYSKEFTENMARITKEIQQNPSSFIKVIIGVDSICERCPHCSDGICNARSSSFNKVMLMDSLVLQNLGIEEGSVISSTRILSITGNLNRQTVGRICGDCFWRKKCLFFQEKMF
jgi:hypothetical protein